ncbi:Tyrosine N-monooxygenase [Hordeum vulgare]|nr:Tyrosine N-monooxygenase [Hordeum vulgare]
MSSVDKINPSGTNDRDRHNIAQSFFCGEEKKTKKGKVKRGREFVLTHCYGVLKDEEKWKKRDDDEEGTKKGNVDAMVLDGDDEEASSDGVERSPTPNSVACKNT